MVQLIKVLKSSNGDIGPVMIKSKGIVFLIVWFIWSAGQDLDSIVRYSIKADYYIYSSNNMAPIFFIFVFLVFSLNIMTIYSLFRPVAIGFYAAIAAIAALALGFVHNTLSFTLALGNLAGVKSAYRIGREVRGLPVRPETLDAVFTPQAMQLGLYASALLYCVALFIVLKNRSHFTQNQGNV